MRYGPEGDGIGRGPVVSGGPSVETLKRARRWCATQFAKRYDLRLGHASHLACAILREADERYSLESFGTEGCTDTTQEGVSYLNMADTYTLTICVETSSRSARFVVASWGDLAEKRENEGGEL